MKSLLYSFRYSILLISLSTVLCLLIYLVMQQTWRRSADSPQAQLAEDMAAKLATGKVAATSAALNFPTVDLEHEHALFIILFDDSGKTVTSTGMLLGRRPAPPAGVLEEARRRHEYRVTWQPARGVREASVIVHYDGGFVLAGRSLSETEIQVHDLGRMIAGGWISAMVVIVIGSIVFGVMGRSIELEAQRVGRSTG